MFGQHTSLQNGYLPFVGLAQQWHTNGPVWVLLVILDHCWWQPLDVCAISVLFSSIFTCVIHSGTICPEKGALIIDVRGPNPQASTVIPVTETASTTAHYVSVCLTKKTLINNALAYCIRLYRTVGTLQVVKVLNLELEGLQLQPQHWRCSWVLGKGTLPVLPLLT